MAPPASAEDAAVRVEATRRGIAAMDVQRHARGNQSRASRTSRISRAIKGLQPTAPKPAGSGQRLASVVSRARTLAAIEALAKTTASEEGLVVTRWRPASGSNFATVELRISATGERRIAVDDSVIEVWSGGTKSGDEQKKSSHKFVANGIKCHLTIDRTDGDSWQYTMTADGKPLVPLPLIDPISLSSPRDHYQRAAAELARQRALKAELQLRSLLPTSEESVVTESAWKALGIPHEWRECHDHDAQLVFVTRSLGVDEEGTPLAHSPEWQMWGVEMLRLVRALRSAGLSVHWHAALDGERVFLMVSAPEARLMLEADRVQMMMRLKMEHDMPTVKRAKATGHLQITSTKSAAVLFAEQSHATQMGLGEGEEEGELHEESAARGSSQRLSQAASGRTTGVSVRDSVQGRRFTARRPKSAKISDLQTPSFAPFKLEEVDKFKPHVEGEFLFSSLERQQLVYSIVEALPAVGGAGIDPARLLHSTFSSWRQPMSQQQILQANRCERIDARISHISISPRQSHRANLTLPQSYYPSLINAPISRFHSH